MSQNVMTNRPLLLHSNFGSIVARPNLKSEPLEINVHRRMSLSEAKKFMSDLSEAIDFITADLDTLLSEIEPSMRQHYVGTTCMTPSGVGVIRLMTGLENEFVDVVYSGIDPVAWSASDVIVSKGSA